MNSEPEHVPPPASRSPNATAPSGSFSTPYRAWLLFVLFLTTALNLADRQGFAAVLPAIRADLHLTDTDLGLLQGLGFAIVYTLMGLPLARLAEHGRRTYILSAATALFGAAVALSSACRGFWQFLLCRVGVGIGDAGFAPTVASLVGDHFPATRRASAMTLVWYGGPFGAFLGAALGGWIAHRGHWQSWFVVLGVLGIVVAVLALLTLREPRRGMSDALAAELEPPPPILATFRFLIGKRSMCHVLAGAALASMTMNGLGQFWGRFFVAVHHTDLAETGRVIGTMGAVAMVAGLSLGGFGADLAGRHDRRWYVWGPGIALLLSTPLLLLGVTRGTMAGSIPILIVGLTLLFAHFTPTLAIAQNMVAANMRASSAFAVAAVISIVGAGIGPTLTGFVSDALAQHAFAIGDYKALCVGAVAGEAQSTALREACATASAGGIRGAIIVMSVFCGLGGLHYLRAARTFRRDIEMLRPTYRASRANATFERVCRASTPQMKAPALMTASRSTPVSMPRPCSR
jgi:predicted MFS family arabinose efflux permease